jgi:DNA polymerase
MAAYSVAMAPESAIPQSPRQASRSKSAAPFLSATFTGPSFSALREAMLACERCPKLVESRSRVVPGDGAVPAEVAFVGLAPGRFGGDRTGIPFDGDRSGQLLRRMIEHARLRGVFITNVVRCNPRDARGRNRDPDKAEIANCRSHLIAELALVRPRIVVCLGRIAWNALAGREYSFEPQRPLMVVTGGIRLLPMYHPAYVIRGAYAAPLYQRDYVHLARLLRAAPARLSPKIRTETGD